MTRNFAHRGFSGMYPENTILSFTKALEVGVDGIEMDVHLSKDGELIVIHDEALKRTTGMEGFVKDYTRAELEKINAGKTMNDEFGFTPIPSFEEYLTLMKDRPEITNVEIKSLPYYYPGIEEKTVEMVRRFGMEDRIIFSSFNWMTVETLGRICPEIPSGLLFDGFPLYNMGAAIRNNGHYALHQNHKFINKMIVDELHANGVKCNVWTVNEEEDIRRCIDAGVDGIIGNFPDRVKMILEG